MVTRRKTLQLIIAGMATLTAAPAQAAAEITVYHSPD